MLSRNETWMIGRIVIALLYYHTSCRNILCFNNTKTQIHHQTFGKALSSTWSPTVFMETIRQCKPKL